MSKIRVYDLAKELNVSSKDLVKKLNDLDIPAKNHMSALTEQEVRYFKSHQNNVNTVKDQKANESKANENVKKDPHNNNKTTVGANHKKHQNTATKSSQNNTHNDSTKNNNNSQNNTHNNSAKNNNNNKGFSNQNKNTKNHEGKGASPSKTHNTNKKKDINKPKVTPVKIDNSKRVKKTKTDYKKRKTEETKVEETILLPSQITVGDLASKINISVTEIITHLIKLGIMASINQEIDFDTAEVIASELDIKVELENVEEEVHSILEEYEDEDDEKDLMKRPPVITVMGHVDHGKTSLLDAIRHTSVTSREAGGITQHIGAYTVQINNESITFIDTPGHEAFTAMRLRGAQITDIAILVVAADDGVMPQTVEAINHAKAAKVPIIVAINKIDKESANPDRVLQELTEHGLIAEAWGGDTICVPVSAHTGEGIDTLLEMILLSAEMLELKANPKRLAKGSVVEAQLDKGRGAVATLLINTGTLRIGDIVVSGTTYGKVRAMVNDKGKRLKSAGPSAPVEIIGLSEVPEAGDEFYVVKDDKTARQVSEMRKHYLKDQQVKKSAPLSLDDLYNQIQEGAVKDINIVIKADGQGSVEALKQSLFKLTNDEVRVNVIHDGVGAISESDVLLASASNGIIIGFNVRPGANVSKIAEKEAVDIRLYRVIYDAIEDVEAAMKGMLDPEFKEVVVGTAEVRETFKVPNIGIIAGIYITDGKIARNNDVRVIRDGIVVQEGSISSLKRFKDDAKEVVQGYECGLGIEKFNDLKEGDIIEAFTMEEIPR
ncbi:translation initiation factor IF-2 [Alkalibaculum bacchi]|uniref:Translation initiation factor IF-2 n=1 Tax=Alkalibaculum bacchi TaxID=645887 RepID=A0A366HZQ0_9FIRM|nr:translation initiation factor IF-2 [Alkalibaculum bacchi]RBP59946.1 translation initiation factor IF-2 [Alkalibaculum bacchi]